ncbi:MAG: hypothetical protein KC425_08985, partial [Anaerolineales bacterium]|nr:hypothetical protein [Anaerolineales bacterium]
WDAHRVRLAVGYQLEGTDVTAAFGPGSASPGREPLLGEFDVAGERLTLLVNHFKSDYVPQADDASRDELIRRAQAQRLTQARVVREWASARLAADPRALLLVAGDLNAPPAGLPVRIVAGGTGETPLTNLLPAHAPAEYTFVLHGQPVILDHLLASPALAARLTAVSVPHPNAAAAPELAADPTTTARASDHDPLLATFKW